MTTTRSRPDGNGAAREDQVDGRSTSHGTELFDPGVENRLDATLWALVAGDIGLEDLPRAQLALWTVAYEAGRASVLPHLRQAEADRDRYFNAAYGSSDQLRHRLDESAKDYWSEFLESEGAA